MIHLQLSITCQVPATCGKGKEVTDSENGIKVHSVHIYLPICLNSRGGHLTGSREPSAGGEGSFSLC